MRSPDQPLSYNDRRSHPHPSSTANRSAKRAAFMTIDVAMAGFVATIPDAGAALLVGGVAPVSDTRG